MYMGFNMDNSVNSVAPESSSCKISTQSQCFLATANASALFFNIIGGKLAFRKNENELFDILFNAMPSHIQLIPTCIPNLFAK
jgi:hypothetical protein